MRSKILLGVAMTILMMTTASACGGDEGRSTDDPVSLSKAQFIKRASAICHRERNNILDEFVTFRRRHEDSQKSESELFADALRVILLPTIRVELAKIKALGSPAGDEAEVAAILAAEQEAVKEVAKLKQSSGRFEIERHFEDAAKLARAYGIPDCGNSSLSG